MGMHENLGVFQDAADIIDADGYSTKFIDMAAVIPKLGVGAHAPMLCIRMVIPSTTAADTLAIEFRQSASVDVDTDGGVLNGTVITVFMPFCAAAGAEIRADDARCAAGVWMWRAPLPYGVNLRYAQLYWQNATHTGHFHVDAWLEDAAESNFRGSQVLVSPVGNP